MIEFVYEGVGNMLEYAEEEIPIIEGLREKLYGNEDWENAFKETLTESLGEYVEKLTAPHMLLISTCVITSGVVFSNYKKIKESGEDFFTRKKVPDMGKPQENSFWKKDQSVPPKQSISTNDLVDELYSSSAKKKKY